MSGTESIRVGNKGRIVLPADIRQRRQWAEGTTLVAVETESGVLLAERSALEEILRKQLSGADVVASLLEDRRRASAAEDDA
ncbi:AbrB/MazE/SpoVT family DNA-binding domain-containing protein [Mycetocola sp. 2940]|uniref:AbrB/MazE/SpoVT family DNA-binding domain-containing protein n=1 Tax=Mycetocola sp. 2940 TaxID=3156452 RepID=UPI00339B0A60